MERPAARMPPRLLNSPEALQRRATKQPRIRCIELLGRQSKDLPKPKLKRDIVMELQRVLKGLLILF